MELVLEIICYRGFFAFSFGVNWRSSQTTFAFHSRLERGLFLPADEGMDNWAEDAADAKANEHADEHAEELGVGAA